MSGGMCFTSWNVPCGMAEVDMCPWVRRNRRLLSVALKSILVYLCRVHIFTYKSEKLVSFVKKT